MKLHRLVLTNYRGITHREIHLPDSGVVVICGANEVGKTSMIEALDLLLDSKDRSTKKEVKQVKPTHADLGSEVLAEISTGPYRFVYRKRFHKKCETELSIVTPRREQLTGDEAHERVLAMLAETVDTDLWHAQRVLQTTSTAAVDLSGCDSLSRALDVAAGDDAALSGSEPLLIEQIDAEYGRYFTTTGRPTGEWATVISVLSSAEAELERCQAAVAEIDKRVHTHEELTEQLAVVGSGRQAVVERAAAAEQAAAILADLTEQLGNAELIAKAAVATSTTSTAALAERVRLRNDATNRAATITELNGELADAVAAEATARTAAESAAAIALESANLVTGGQARVDRARNVVEACAARAEADRIAVRLDRIDSVHGDLELIDQQLVGISLTDEVLRDIESATTTVQNVLAQLELTAATVEFTAAADLQLIVDGEFVQLVTGQKWTPPTASLTTVEVPGLLSVRLDPGVSTSDLQAKLLLAQQLQAETLDRGGVADVAAARELDRRRQELSASRSQMVATLAGLTAGDDVIQLRARLGTLRDVQATHQTLLDAGVDSDAARAELTAATEDLGRLTSSAAAHQESASEARSALHETSTRTTSLSGRVASENGELASVERLLAAQRLECTDEELASRTEADAEAGRQAEDEVAVLVARRAATDPAAVSAELDAARTAATQLDVTVSTIEQALNNISVELAVMGDDGRKSDLDAAQSAREHAAAQYSRVSARARAAQMLRSVLSRHRDDTRLRYVDPFRAEIERIGKPVFGPTFEVEVDSDLRIFSRTLDGRTVPFESLSSGAKEQLGILARLAGAALVAKEDTVPVVLDDALGFTDPERLAKMAEVFNTLGDHGQVIVLTCMPERYLGIDDAHLIELTA